MCQLPQTPIIWACHPPFPVIVTTRIFACLLWGFHGNLDHLLRTNCEGGQPNLVWYRWYLGAVTSIDPGRMVEAWLWNSLWSVRTVYWDNFKKKKEDLILNASLSVLPSSPFFNFSPDVWLSVGPIYIFLGCYTIIRQLHEHITPFNAVGLASQWSPRPGPVKDIPPMVQEIQPQHAEVLKVGYHTWLGKMNGSWRTLFVDKWKLKINQQKHWKQQSNKQTINE